MSEQTSSYQMPVENRIRYLTAFYDFWEKNRTEYGKDTHGRHETTLNQVLELETLGLNGTQDYQRLKHRAYRFAALTELDIARHQYEQGHFAVASAVLITVKNFVNRGGIREADISQGIVTLDAGLVELLGA